MKNCIVHLLFVISCTLQLDTNNLTISDTFNYEYELVDTLFKNYSSKVRPAKNYSQSITVYVDPIIYSLIEVDERQESLKFIEWRNVAWKDEYLTWNPDEFGGVTKVVVPNSQVWKPDIIIFNTIKREEEIQPIELNVQIYSNGVITWWLNEVLTVRCTFQIMWFPFDTQNCTLKYGTWSYPSRFIKLNTSMEKSYTMNGSSEWDVISFTGQLKTEQYSVMFVGKIMENVDFDELHYHFVFKRKPTYYIFVLIIPTFIIATISILGLFSPFSSGRERCEKVNLGLTTLLTMAIMLQIVADAVPRTREGLPLLGIYMMYEFVVASVGTCITVIIMYLHHRALQLCWEPPKWLLCITCAERKRYKPLSNRLYERMPLKKDKFYRTAHQCQLGLLDKRFQTDILTNLRICADHVRAMKEILLEREKYQKREETWSRIFDKVDIYLLIVFMLGNITLTFAVFSVVILGHHDKT